MIKKLLPSTLITIFATLVFMSCNTDEPNPCSCPQVAPWSVPGSDNCYTDPFVCETEEGQECEICS